MRAYFDSGFLFKLYWQEANTPAAQAIVLQYDFATRVGIRSIFLPP